MIAAADHMPEKHRLLLVDDSAMNLDTLLATLGDVYDLRVAIDGSSALQLIRRGFLPELILLDIMMPEMDGYSVCRELKKDPQTLRIPVIFLTALDSEDDEAKGLEMGAVDYITKPFNPAIVRQRVQNQLELKRHRDHLEELVDEKTRELSAAYHDLKKVHEQMLKQEKMASIGQLAAGVAHEINNPAGFISSNFNSLKKYTARLEEGLDIYQQLCHELGDAELDKRLDSALNSLQLPFIREDLQELISESQDGIERIATIVRNLKSFARSENETLHEENLHRCLDSALNIVFNEIKYKAEVIKDYQPLPLVSCLPQQLGQVFVNLLVNAAQAIEGQGRITLRTWQEPGWAVVAVCDNGCGIAKEHLGQLFTPFFTTKEDGKGTGLGLSLCHDIVRKHHGVMTVTSEPGEGSCFTVKLPLEIIASGGSTGGH